jgi:NAD(P)-dependent dehydrogenase (short-subunit alcohol dehydrogenase family)
MLSTPGSRVVLVTSLMRRVGRIDFDDLHGRARYGRWSAYGQSKLADLVFAVELDRRLRAAKADTVAVAAHPGYAATNLQTGTSWLQSTYYAIGNTLFAQPAYAGAWPQLYAATATAVQGGELYGPGQAGGSRGYPKRDRIESRALDEATGRRLWYASVQATGVGFDALG